MVHDSVAAGDVEPTNLQPSSPGPGTELCATPGIGLRENPRMKVRASRISRISQLAVDLRIAYLHKGSIGQQCNVCMWAIWILLHVLLCDAAGNLVAISGCCFKMLPSKNKDRRTRIEVHVSSRGRTKKAVLKLLPAWGAFQRSIRPPNLMEKLFSLQPLTELI